MSTSGSAVGHTTPDVRPLTVEARFTTTSGEGVGRWRMYYRAEGLRDAKWAARRLVPKAQVRVKHGRDVVAGPMLAEEFTATV